MHQKDRNLRFRIVGQGKNFAFPLSLSLQSKSGLGQPDLERMGHHEAAPASGSQKSDLKRYEQAIGALIAELASVRDKERRKIADDLHDQIGQNLVLAKMKLAALKGLLPKKHSALVEEVGNLISDTIKDTRSLIHELSPQVLHELGLEAGINWLMEEIRANYGLLCSAEIGLLPQSLSQDVQLILFQAVRELLINVAKHADARQARVIFGRGDGFLRIQVVDDGRGFDPRDIILSGSELGKFGLFSMRARLAPLGGSLHIDSHAGAGTSATIILPLNN